MKIILYSKHDAETIKSALGSPDYGYYFVRRYFARALSQNYEVIEAGPDLERIRDVYTTSEKAKEKCVCLAFCAPQNIPADLPCRVIPFVSWAFDTLPKDINDDPGENWPDILDRLGAALTLSSHAADSIRSEMGKDYPVASIPVPVFERFIPKQKPKTTISFEGNFLDSQKLSLENFSWDKKFDHIPLLFEGFSQDVSAKLKLDGVVYLTVFDPKNPLKNWLDQLKAFCWQFRKESGATLVVKTVSHDLRSFIFLGLSELYRLHPFKCRVVIMRGFLDETALHALYARSDFFINGSEAEGQAMPVLEAMALGTPVIAPDHTALADFISAKDSYVIPSDPEPAHWPHDMRQNLRALKYRLDWTAMTRHLSSSFKLKTKKPDSYAKKCAAVQSAAKAYCSDAKVLKVFDKFLADHYDALPKPIIPKAAAAAMPKKPQENKPQKNKPLPVLPVGRMLPMNSERKDYARWLGPNWFNLGPGGVWMRGSQGQITLRTVLSKAGKLHLSLNAFLPPGQDNKLTISVGKRECFTTDIKQDSKMIEAYLDVVKDDFKDGQLTLTLSAKTCFKPADFAKNSQDQRELSVRLKSIEFKSAKRKKSA